MVDSHTKEQWKLELALKLKEIDELKEAVAGRDKIIEAQEELIKAVELMKDQQEGLVRTYASLNECIYESVKTAFDRIDTKVRIAEEHVRWKAITEVAEETLALIKPKTFDS